MALFIWSQLSSRRYRRFLLDKKKRFLFPSRIMTSCVKTSSAMKVSENNKYVCIAAADHGCLSAQSFFTVETSVTASGRMVAWMKLVLPLLKYD